MKTEKMKLPYPVEGEVEWYYIYEDFMKQLDAWLYGAWRRVIYLFDNSDLTMDSNGDLVWQDLKFKHPFSSIIYEAKGPKRVTMSEEDYVACVPSDVGKKVVVQGGNMLGVLLAYDNEMQVWWVETFNDLESGVGLIIQDGVGQGKVANTQNGLKVGNYNLVYFEISETDDKVMLKQADFLDINTISVGTIILGARYGNKFTLIRG